MAMIRIKKGHSRNYFITPRRYMYIRGVTWTGVRGPQKSKVPIKASAYLVLSNIFFPNLSYPFLVVQPYTVGIRCIQPPEFFPLTSIVNKLCKVLKHFVNTTFNAAPLVYYRSQWENVRGVEYFCFQLYI